MKVLRLNLYLLLLVALLTGACKKNQEEIIPDAQYIVSAELVTQLSKNQIDSRLAVLPGASQFTRFDVSVFRVRYKTINTDNSSVEASGLVIIPRNSPESLPLLAQQRGTITADAQAPSAFQDGTEAATLGLLWASAGYVNALADFIGFGSTASLRHPYIHAASHASTTRDMMRAARELCARERVALNGKVFLTGYSQGGYATMAAHKLIEESHPNEFNIVASAPAAGPYHISRFMRFIANANTNLESINLYLWVLDSYNRIYGLNYAWSDILNEPFASAVQQGGVFVQVSPNPQQLFRSTFLNTLRNGTDARLVAALRENDIHQWTPKAPVVLFHGNADTTVPFFSSEDALAGMRTSSNSVELRTIAGGTHSTAIPFYVLGTYTFFNSLR